MSKQQITFTLSKNGESIGQIEWTYHTGRLFPIGKSGKISGDEMAVATLNKTIEQSQKEGWLDIAPDSDGFPLSDPLSNNSGMLSLLVLGGFDIPDELMPHYRSMLGQRDNRHPLLARVTVF